MTRSGGLGHLGLDQPLLEGLGALWHIGVGLVGDEVALAIKHDQPGDARDRVLLFERVDPLVGKREGNAKRLRFSIYLSDSNAREHPSILHLTGSFYSVAIT